MDKQSLRKAYLNKRSLLSKDEVDMLSEKIASNFFKQFDSIKISSLHIFLPIKHKSEINTWFIIEQLRTKFPKVRIVVPKIKGDILLSYLIDSKTEFVVNKWGIAEPLDAEEFSTPDLDMILVPLLAFDKVGHRVGYGKGFYDRFFVQCRKNVVKVGLSFFEPEERISAEPFDVPLDFCVTPDKVYSFEKL